ncbi:HAMP domain-containing histidine kinase [Enterococcus sp. BWM-S5]|uniref:histidine kinase n=1 Tax=Enterococcus larvae TaxID=2794352 RepID=A0ABS4CFY8_9ENTE|nr:HAMP domain-containing sensor histidine kinase [Enterococcus larvae]MBP1045541.1 HAMP domain-containing histidine kinase [Enterococcus larvae]
MWVSAVLLGVVGVLFYLLLNSKREHEKELEQAAYVLDSVIQGEFPIDDLRYREGLEAKLVFKALRVAEINRFYAGTAREEQEKTQELVADISHQMRTPLSSIMMYTELMADERLSKKEENEFLNRIALSSEKLFWLISEFITISRFEAKSMQLQTELGNLSDTIQQAIDMQKEHGRSKRLSFHFQPTGEFTLAHDLRWTKEAISNILDNAVKYSREDSEIVIDVERLVFYTRIQITNIGQEISSEEQLLAFQKYFRGMNAKEEEGAGIGLYLVKLIVEEQGGYSIIESKNGKTIISLFLLN